MVSNGTESCYDSKKGGGLRAIFAGRAGRGRGTATSSLDHLHLCSNDGRAHEFQKLLFRSCTEIVCTGVGLAGPMITAECLLALTGKVGKGQSSFASLCLAAGLLGGLDLGHCTYGRGDWRDGVHREAQVTDGQQVSIMEGNPHVPIFTRAVCRRLHLWPRRCRPGRGCKDCQSCFIGLFAF
jgi:hypothetical protein